MTSPVVGRRSILDDAATDRGLPADHAARTAAYNEMLDDVVRSRAGDVSMFRYDEVIAALGADVVRMFPDGVHPTWETATELWSGPRVRALRRPHPRQRRRLPTERPWPVPTVGRVTVPGVRGAPSSGRGKVPCESH